MHFSTFLKVIFVASLCFLTIFVEAHYLKTERAVPLDCLPTNFTCDNSEKCCNNCINFKCT